MENELDMQPLPQDQLAEAGRGTDKVMAHLSLGEIVIPRAFQDDPEVMAVLQQMFEAGGADINEFTVGHEANKINPETGYPEFGFFRSLRNIVRTVAPIAVSFIPGIGPLAGAALGAGIGAVGGGGIKGALSGALSGYAGAGGAGIFGKALGATTSAGQSALGGALLGAGAGGISGGAKGALIGGAAGGIGGYAKGGGFDSLYSGSALESAYNGSALQNLYTGASGALDRVGSGISDLYNGSALQGLYTGASGALDRAGSGISDLYNGSALQDAFKSGGDALKSIGVNTSSDSLGAGAGASGGGGVSSYGNGTQLPWLAEAAKSPAEQGLLSSAQSALGTGDAYINTAADNQLLSNAKSALNNGGSQVASSNYASPISSALLGSYTNNKAEDQLLAQQRANQSLLAPYQNFKFSPDDLTQDAGYQFNLEQGNQALDRAQLSRGGYFSGQALKEAQNFGQGLADNTYNTAFNRALQTQGAGLQAAGALAGVNDVIGGARAKTTINNGNLYSGVVGSILGGNSFTNSGALQGGSGDYLSNLLRQLKLQQLTAA